MDKFLVTVRATITKTIEVEALTHDEADGQAHETFNIMSDAVEETYEQDTVSVVKKDIGNGLTTPDYWDCECEENYIHPKAYTGCILCRMTHDECPDSRIIEVQAMLERLHD